MKDFNFSAAGKGDASCSHTYEYAPGESLFLGN